MSQRRRPPDPDPPPAPDDVRSAAIAAVSFVVGILGAVAFAVLYTLDPATLDGRHTQALGVSFMVALGGMGIGLVVWAHGLMPQGPDVERREFPGGEPIERRRMLRTLRQDTARVGRRSLLGRLLLAALGATGVAALFPLRSLGPSPFPERSRTGWRPGTRVVTEDGQPLRIGELPQNSVLTVFPEGRIRSADSQTILVRVPPDLLRPLRGREDWTPRGHVAYSKVCTHAGCPVGLYQVEKQRLFCPCHQSAFDILRAAQPIFGPATRPLPQLPLGVDDEGFLVALADFDVPVGPGFWTWPSAVEGDDRW